MRGLALNTKVLFRVISGRTKVLSFLSRYESFIIRGGEGLSLEGRIGERSLGKHIEGAVVGVRGDKDKGWDREGLGRRGGDGET